MRTIPLALLLAALGLALSGGAPGHGTANAEPAVAAQAASVNSASSAADDKPAKPASADAEPSPQAGTGGTALGARPVSLDTAALRKALTVEPVLAELAPQFELFTAADVDAALRRGGRSRESIHVWTFMPAAFSWNPRPGRELLVLSGRSGARALIAVLAVKGDHAYQHVASLIVHEAEATLAVGFSDQYPDQLVWSSCYGCAGEGGTVRWLEDGRVEFGYR